MLKSISYFYKYTTFYRTTETLSGHYKIYSEEPPLIKSIYLIIHTLLRCILIPMLISNIKYCRFQLYTKHNSTPLIITRCSSCKCRWIGVARLLFCMISNPHRHLLTRTTALIVITQL